ncbi:hypothetical protein LMG28138_04533 [Pararobbsia alpina]|uniref:DUF4398 domain-containing protein n=1 Tax=Pararobbsia alpina TaxID=621374 RepID=A0A6S7BG56_9BURK|nr:hypothetical protein LMG28138_04533 [Pararobbsia alpina]
MHKHVPAILAVFILATSAQAQTGASMPSAAEVEAGATIPCPAGVAQYCERRAYENKRAAIQVETARKQLALAQEFYENHPDAEHAARLEEAKARLGVAVQQQGS